MYRLASFLPFFVRMPALIRNARALGALPRSESLNRFDAAKCSRTTSVAVCVTLNLPLLPAHCVQLLVIILSAGVRQSSLSNKDDLANQVTPNSDMPERPEIAMSHDTEDALR